MHLLIFALRDYALMQVPQQRVHLAVGLPTPIHPWRVPGMPDGVDLWIKRDDVTGMQLSGNKAGSSSLNRWLQWNLQALAIWSA